MTGPAQHVPRGMRLAAVLTLMASAAAPAADPRRELRVCADPDNLPFSNIRLEGFENKIAGVVAADLNASVRYTWRPQRRGFIRQTLQAGKCDVVIGVPSGYEPVLTTKPYYGSSYVFVYAKGRTPGPRSLDDPLLRKVRIGLQAFGDDGANAPPAHALAHRGIVRNIVGFTLLPGEDSPPGTIIDAVARGEIDVAIVWGPFAGYFVRREPVALEMAPVSPSMDQGFLPFTYDISMGVRPGDTAFKQELEAVLERRRGEVRNILEAYGVPLVAAEQASDRNRR